jgi:CDGSH-type Zn-finger protein/uncharacterized Fe-S cluster protein YjdI
VSEKVLVYRGENIEISYDVARCIHAAECVKRLPAVFDPKRKPWIDADAAGVEEVANTVQACPTGALGYQRLDGGPAEGRPSENTVSVSADGPLYLRGHIKVIDGSGNPIDERYRLALCRCGESKTKPVCDGSHEGCHFEDAGSVDNPSAVEGEVSEGSETLEVTCNQNGPFTVQGQLTLINAFGDEVCSGNTAYLCRCGASQNKPFCDGSHKTVGFKSAN